MYIAIPARGSIGLLVFSLLAVNDFLPINNLEISKDVSIAATYPVLGEAMQSRSYENRQIRCEICISANWIAAAINNLGIAAN